MKGVVLAVVLAVSAVPAPVVERVVEQGGRTVRLTLFDNRVAVVSVRTPGSEPTVHRRTLEPEEYVVYLGALNRDAAELAAEAEPVGGARPGQRCGLVLHVGDGPPLELEYSPLRVPSLALGRLGAALDDLERRVLETPEGFDALVAWQPRRGERVAMRRGGVAVVDDVREDGTVVLRYENVALLEVVPPAERAERIERVLGPAP